MNVSVLLKISDKKDEILSVFSLDVKDMLKEIKHITSCVDNSDKTTQEKANEYTNKIKECLHKEDTVVLYRNVMALFYLYNINYTNIAINGLYITFESYICEDKYDILRRIYETNIKDLALLN